jgi:hypothetical protein
MKAAMMVPRAPMTAVTKSVVIAWPSGRLLPSESRRLYSMAGDRSKLDGVEAEADSADHRPTKPERAAKEALEGVEAASQAYSDSPH